MHIPGSGDAAATDVKAPEPGVTTHAGLLAWVDALPHAPPPTWLGLAATADNRLLMQRVSGVRSPFAARAWGVGRGAWGVGRGAWGVGRGAWGVGRGAYVVGTWLPRACAFTMRGWRLCA
jgi:hypothetical protein